MAQYTRCGCQTECPCVLVGGRGIQITGTGNPDDPYVISTDGTIDCKLVQDCICKSAGPGIRCINGTLGTYLSSDQPNNMSYGTDGGLKSSCDCKPDPASCNRMTTDLDAKPFVWGTMSGGRAVVPYGTMRSWDHAVAVRSDINADWTGSLNGCVAHIAPYPTFKGFGKDNKQTWAHPNIAKVADSTSYGDGVDYYRMTAAQWLSIGKYPAPLVNAQDELTGGGYYDAGWDNRPADGGTLVSEVFAKYANKTVNAFFLYNITTYTGLIKTIEYWCTQTSSIIFHWTAANLRQALDHNIPAGIMVFPAVATPNPDYPWIGNYTDTLAAEAKAAGATWAAVSMRLTDAQIATFTAAGLKVLGFDTIRQIDATRAKTLALRGLLSDDLVYQRAGDPTHQDAACFLPQDHDTWWSGAAMYGQAYPPDNTSAFRNERGYPRISNEVQGGAPPAGARVGCWHLPANFGDYVSTGEDGDQIPALLLGGMSNHEKMRTPAGYRVSFLAGWVNATESDYQRYGYNAPANPTGTVDKFGLFFCAPTDQNISGPLGARRAQGYFAFVRPSNGQLVLGIRDTTGGDARGWQTLGTASGGGALLANNFYRMNVVVAPDRISFSINRTAGRQTLTVTSAQNPLVTKFRPPQGGYIFIAKEELTAAEFECRFADVYTTTDLTP